MKSNSFTNWYTMVFNGIVALLYGILALFIPSNTLLTVVMWFGILIMIVGVIGAVLGGFLFGLIGFSSGGGFVGSLVTALVGAVVLLFIVGLVKKKG